MACFHHSCFRTGVWRCLELDVVTLETRHFFFPCKGVVREQETRKKRKKKVKTLLLLPFKILWFLIKLPFKILKVIFSGASVKSGGLFN